MISWKHAWRHDTYTRWLAWVAGVATGALAISLSVHAAAFYLFQLPLPKDRTALYFVPLSTLPVGFIIATPMRSRLGRVIRTASMSVVLAVAIYYLSCLRLWYFKEWWWDADVKDAYAVLAEYNHRCSITSVDANGLYGSSLNFYRSISGRESFGEFDVTVTRTPDKDLYILHSGADRNFIEANRLRIVYRGRLASLVIALSPSAVAKIAASGCCRDAWRRSQTPP